MTLMWTFRGIPTLYYGSEIEFKKGQRIDCGPSCPLETTGRAYYGNHLAGTVTAGDFGTVASASGAVATTLSQPLVKHVQRLNQIRRAVPALQMGQYSTDGISGNMAYKRRYTANGVDSFALVTVSSGATFSGIPPAGPSTPAGGARARIDWPRPLRRPGHAHVENGQVGSLPAGRSTGASTSSRSEEKWSFDARRGTCPIVPP